MENLLLFKEENKTSSRSFASQELNDSCVWTQSLLQEKKQQQKLTKTMAKLHVHVQKYIYIYFLNGQIEMVLVCLCDTVNGLIL